MVNGCRHWRDCLTCPLPECFVGREKAFTKLLQEYETESLFRQGYSITDIATKLNKNYRTIERYLRRNYEHIKQNT